MPTPIDDRLSSWIALNDYLMTETQEAPLEELLRAAKERRSSITYVRRIYARLSRVRRLRERAELEG